MNFNKFETLVFLIYLFNINQVIFTRDVRFGIRANVLICLGKMGSELTASCL